MRLRIDVRCVYVEQATWNNNGDVEKKKKELGEDAS